MGGAHLLWAEAFGLAGDGDGFLYIGGGLGAGIDEVACLEDFSAVVHYTMGAFL